MIDQSKAWRHWLCDAALPLWATAGFDHSLKLFHERLTFANHPIVSLNRRLMVQARQIITYSMAARDGLYPQGYDLARETLERVRALYHRRDGQPGWVFSLLPDGAVAEARRDLYAHAFILYAHAAVAQGASAREQAVLYRNALEGLAEIEALFAVHGGGYRDAVPEVTAIRRQNPHMHLLEAMLALFDVFQDDVFRIRAQALVELACTRFVDSISGMLLEFFDPHWQPLEAQGYNRVEPGHMFEWSWLLEESARLGIVPEARIRPIADRLFAQAWRYGVDHADACVWDAVRETGQVMERGARIWAQTELMRLLWRWKIMKRLTREQALFLERFSQRFLAMFLPSAQHGSWIDWRDAEGKALVDFVPASSFYHIYGAARCFVLQVG